MVEDFRLKDIFEKYRENKNSHVYLVETNSIERAINDIKQLIICINNKELSNISFLVESDSLPTLMIVRPKLQEIVTEDIEKLILMLQKIPVITRENYFIVSEAEKLNKKSGNQMLKIIEEPDTEMLGFFVCNSADRVMPTITSRTQILYLNYDVDESFSDDILEDTNNYLLKLHEHSSIIINKYYIDKYKDLNDFNSFVKCLIYQQKKHINKQTSFDIIKKESQILKLLFAILPKIGFNCNSNLLLDKFVIEVSRLK